MLLARDAGPTAVSVQRPLNAKKVSSISNVMAFVAAEENVLVPVVKRWVWRPREH